LIVLPGETKEIIFQIAFDIFQLSFELFVSLQDWHCGIAERNDN